VNCRYVNAASAREVLKVGSDQLRVSSFANKVCLLIQDVAHAIAGPVHGKVKDLLKREDEQAEARQIPRKLDSNLRLLDLFEREEEGATVVLPSGLFCRVV
jgi:hypothetical protein